MSEEQRDRRDGGDGANDRRHDSPRQPRYSDFSRERRPQSGGDRPERGGDRPYRGDRPQQQGGDRPYRGDRPHHGGDRPQRDGDRPYRGDRPQHNDRDRRHQGDRPQRDGERRGFPQRGGVDRPRSEFAPVRERVPEPEIPEEITPRDLHPAARNELKTLSKENAEQVARHLAMAARLIDEDPERAHEHALAASRRAGRVAVVRETLAITSYRIGDFALALRELRTYRRISGKDDQIALIVDSERGVGRPDRALEEGRAVERSSLTPAARVALAIAMSGARLDRGETELALGELEIPELDPDRAFEWSPALFSARAAVLEDLGRTDEAAFWTQRAEAAASALGLDDDEDEIIIEETELEETEEENED